MVYYDVLTFILAGGILFASLFFLTPTLYDFWFNNLREQNNSENQEIGDRFFNTFLIMGYASAGILIAWGFALAARQRVREDVVE